MNELIEGYAINYSVRVHQDNYKNGQGDQCNFYTRKDIADTQKLFDTSALAVQAMLNELCLTKLPEVTSDDLYNYFSYYADVENYPYNTMPDAILDKWKANKIDLYISEVNFSIQKVTKLTIPFTDIIAKELEA